MTPPKTDPFARRAIFLGLITIIIFLSFVFWGIPFLIRLTTIWNRQKPIPVPAEVIAPLPPRFISLPEATNSAILTLNGLADPDSKIILHIGATASAVTKSDDQGNFSFRHINLQVGKNTFWAQAEKDQQKSKPSNKYDVIFDNQPPSLEIKKPDKPTSVSYQDTVEIQGTTEPDVKLTINNHLVLVDSQGHFATKMELATGDNKFVIQAKDNAGNTTQKTIVVTYHP